LDENEDQELKSTHMRFQEKQLLSFAELGMVRCAGYVDDLILVDEPVVFVQTATVEP